MQGDEGYQRPVRRSTDPVRLPVATDRCAFPGLLCWRFQFTMTHCIAAIWPSLSTDAHCRAIDRVTERL